MASNFTVQYDAVDLPKGATAQARRLKVAWRGRQIAAFSQSAHRAYVYPVFTPAGVPVTGEMPIDHPHHNSITVGADHFNCHFQYATGRLEDGTYNFYINDIFQGRAPGAPWPSRPTAASSPSATCKSSSRSTGRARSSGAHPTGAPSPPRPAR